MTPTHSYIGKFYYCVGTGTSKTQHNVEFIPTTALSGKIVGSAINGNYSVDINNGNWSSIYIDRPQDNFSAEQKTYSTTITVDGAKKKIVFTDRTPSTSNEASYPPKHNGNTTGPYWLSGDGSNPPTCEEF